ncbi:hypothetical protein EOPP23_09465 [Endozoicomonas sp. OPT23]|uniref:SMP-30/gluconolactonase/LRE family protein n=1 Tax=Endozoicomonas sp. OPT23 TaxID=2072845 RepID=UPI00129A25F8|nr:SMP-30/gluconolactonase/LRE family protein [Endozoicomonas sp. OPT23]MRI33211.1 hypothetical protein [Endozoicomonas sp. OPT23]
MIFAEGLEYPEAPLLLSNNDWLVAEMAMGSGRLTQLSACGEHRKTFTDCSRPNGLLLDKDGKSIWAAETWQPSLIKFDELGAEVLRITSCGDLSFMWPNDLVYGPDGYIYLTDSGILVRDLIKDGRLDPDVWNSPMRGRLFRIDPVTHSVECLDEGLLFANGLAFGPDGNLYLAETVTGLIYRYVFSSHLELESKEIFTSVTDPSGPSRVVGPDGITFDQAGNLYAAIFGQGHVACVSPEGVVSRSLVTRGSCPTNVSFGPEDSKQLYVTEYQRGRVEVFDLSADGFAGY